MSNTGKCYCVTSWYCLAPANAPGTVRTVCWNCGNTVCRECSKRMLWVWARGSRGQLLVKRICDYCQQERERERVR